MKKTKNFGFMKVLILEIQNQPNLCDVVEGSSLFLFATKIIFQFHTNPK